MNSFPDQTHYDLLIKAQRGLDGVLPLIEKAEACGMDCQEFRSGHAAMSSQVGAWLRAFFPDQMLPASEAGISTQLG
jgi:hypothetical protein